jgi:hypothetical protein
MFWCLRILAQGDHPQKVWSQSVFGVLEELIRKDEEQSSRKDFEQRILQQLLDELSDLAAVSELLEVTQCHRPYIQSIKVDEACELGKSRPY